jgi:hypothetical protein
MSRRGRGAGQAIIASAFAPKALRRASPKLVAADSERRRELAEPARKETQPWRRKAQTTEDTEDTEDSKATARPAEPAVTRRFAAAVAESLRSNCLLRAFAPSWASWWVVVVAFAA